MGPGAGDDGRRRNVSGGFARVVFSTTGVRGFFVTFARVVGVLVGTKGGVVAGVDKRRRTIDGVVWPKRFNTPGCTLVIAASSVIGSTSSRSSRASALAECSVKRYRMNELK